jgi:chromosome partitioning protein
MKTIAINSIKGGTGKSTLALLLIKALTGAGFRCLVLDADSSNHSVSFFLSEKKEVNPIQDKTIFHLFMGESIRDCVTTIDENLDLITGVVRLNEFRSTDSLKRLKRSIENLEYDFTIIDTSPTYDNIIGNVLTASDFLLIPIQQDLFSFQALQYQFTKLTDLELSDLDIHIIFNQFEKPLTENQEAYRNQITNLFLEDEKFEAFINPNRISRLSTYRKYINRHNYRIDRRSETIKAHEEVKNLIQSILGISIKDGL